MAPRRRRLGAEHADRGRPERGRPLSSASSGLLGGPLRRLLGRSSSPRPSWPAPSWPRSSSLAVFLAGAFFAAVFLAGAFLAGVFLAGAFLAAVFLAGRLLGRGLLRRCLLGRRLLGRGLLRRSSSWRPRPSSPGRAFLAAAVVFAAAATVSFGSFLAPETTFFRSCPGGELRDRRLLGLDRRSRLRVADPAGLADLLLERAEARDRDLLALRDLPGDRVEHGLERVRCLLAVALETRGQRVDEL